MIHFKYFFINSFWWLIFGTICVLTLATRFYKIAEPDHVWLVRVYCLEQNNY